MPTGPRDIVQDAFYQDEWPIVPVRVSNPRGVQFSRFTTVTPAIFGPPTIEPMTKYTGLLNPMDPWDLQQRIRRALTSSTN